VRPILLKLCIRVFSVVLAKGFHPFPFRTRQLSPSAPMVLHGKLCGRVGRRRGINFRGPKSDLRAFSFSERGHRRWRPALPGEPEGEHPLGIIQCGRPRFPPCARARGRRRTPPIPFIPSEARDLGRGPPSPSGFGTLRSIGGHSRCDEHPVAFAGSSANGPPADAALPPPSSSVPARPNRAGGPSRG
jgi:hypothetical protein